MNIMQQIEAEQAARLPGSKIPAFQAGDTVVVNVKVTEGDRSRVQAYEGVCIARSGHGLNESFTVRKISYGEGVERVFPVYSPVINSVRSSAGARCAAPSFIICAIAAASRRALPSAPKRPPPARLRRRRPRNRPRPRRNVRDFAGGEPAKRFL